MAQPTIVELHEPAQHHAAALLLARVWESPVLDSFVPALFTALAHSGSYIVGTYVDGQMVATAIGLLGTDHLHSHVTGVLPQLRRSGIGYAIKTHQRQWAAERGLAEIRWTFDPLVSRNAAFNLHRLGAAVGDYRVDFYGPLDDGINAGDETDRLWARWSVSAPTPSEPAADLASVGDVHILLDRDLTAAPFRSATTLAVATPADVEALRRASPEEAARWRLAVRAALTAALEAGFVITGITRDGYYTLAEARP
jgi:predicted GNAT superfamily acetyltransferase